MIRCPACAQGAPEDSRFCPRCGTPLEVASATPTRTSVPSEFPPRAAAPARHITTDPSGGSRFLPGTVLAGRYRVLGLLGRGGMGEVYRADDLKLGQAVALKFLPASVAKDEARLQRFLNEVKIARQISHPGVCRVYDVGEVGPSTGSGQGHHFISMECVDGEDLASLLRRIGRLPRDKAVQIARQLCAGLAAAHDQGVLHRDLKPANVMIDGRGRAKIADFGLAALAEEIGAAEVGAGTPAYMAPEQLAGKGVSVKSDVYSLGLVLYELFTGQPAFKAATPAELARLQETSTPTSPGRLVEGLDPTIERAILRCLEKEPGRRPASALAVAAALPGGDPLAAALAAGETPSPEMVAEAGEAGGLHPRVAVACLAALVVGLILNVVARAPRDLVLFSRPQKPPADLTVEARQTIVEAGYADEPADSARYLTYDADRLNEIESRDSSTGRWEQLRTARPSPFIFFYRQSPRSLVRYAGVEAVTEEDPPQTVSGMVSVRLDTSGRLLRFLAVPPQLDESKAPALEVDWNGMLRRAGLEVSSVTPAQPAWNPLVDCDARRAWTGAYPDRPDLKVRVEAGAYRGKPVYFEVVPPWAKPWRQQVEPWKAGQKPLAILFTVILVFIVVGAALLARRNLRLGRADRRGAFRLAAFYFLLELLRVVLLDHHVAEFAEIVLIFLSTAEALLLSALVWLVFIALEPYVRRLWPEVLISWNRLLAGRLRDPKIGRDIVLGGAAFGCLQVPWLLSESVDRWMGVPPGMPATSSLYHLSGTGWRAATFLSQWQDALFSAILILFLVLLLRVILRRQWAAVGALLLLGIAINLLQSTNPKVDWVFLVLGWGTFLFVLIRFGLLASVAMFLFGNLSITLPLLHDFPAWYAQPFVVELLAIAALAAYGFVVSLAGRPIFREPILPS